MEIVIPFLAVGGMYIINDRFKKNKNKESIQNLNNVDENEVEQNDNENKQNAESFYLLKSELDQAPANSKYDVNNYYNANQTTDKFFLHTNYSKPNAPIESMTGNTIESNEFIHNNMVPFFGAKLKGNVEGYDQPAILDNLNGSGSLLIKKSEEAPLFKPHENMSFPNGTPNNSDFFQSRVNPSMKMANIKPWKEEQVGPGLNLGYTTKGAHNSLEERCLYMPKTVNQLRVDNNPKLSYSLSGHQGPAGFFNPTMGEQGIQEYHGPSKTFANDDSQWNSKDEHGLGANIGFTTVGAATKPTSRSLHINKVENRTTTTRAYEGVAQSTSRVNYNKDTYSTPNRQDNCSTTQFTPATFSSQGNLGTKTYHILDNNRCVNKSNENPSEYGFVGSAIGAVIAPLIDVLRPTRKENVIGNIRLHGEVQAHVPNSYVNNQNDLPTTNRQMQSLSNNHLNINSQTPGTGYTVADYTPQSGMKNDASLYYTGISGNNGYGSLSHEASDNQICNVSKELTSYNRIPVGNASTSNQLQKSYSVCKPEKDRENNRLWVPSGDGLPLPPSVSTMGKTDCVNQLPEYDRLQPDLLKAFKENPYTHSLNSTA
jgi:hypothetical protein